MPLRIHFVRHGETTANREGRFCGLDECELTRDGRRMAAAVAERCASAGRWLGIYSSPLQRCVETVRPAAERLGLTVIVEPGLREIDHGTWDGRLEDEVAAHEADAYRAWRDHPGWRGAPGGENGFAVSARAVPVVDRIRETHAGQDGDVLVASHKAVIRIVACALLGMDVDRYRTRLAQPVATFTSFEFREGSDEALLIGLGDASHLAPDLARPADS
jgi:broad specificity phosphatase PhoE